MLQRLVIRNIAVIDEVDIHFKAGLCVLTGETGAGKSILLDALQLALGERADPNLLRPGAETASVTATFTAVNETTKELLTELGIPLEEDLLMCRRVLSADRTSRAFVNDVPVSLNGLKQLAKHLVDIHGQFDAYSTSDDVLALLDDVGETTSSRENTRAAFNTLKVVREELENFQLRRKNARERLPYLEQQLKEFKGIALKEGEFQELVTLRQEWGDRAKNADAIQGVLALFQGDRSFISRLLELQKGVMKLEGSPYIGTFLQSLDHFIIEIQELQHSLEAHHREISSTHLSYEAVEERLFVLRALARKFMCEPEELPQVEERLKEELNQIEHADLYLEELETQKKAAESAFLACALSLSEARKKVAQEIEKAVNQELPALKLEQAEFVLYHDMLSGEKWREDGVDRFSFQIRTFKGAALAPLSTIASGGERSRFFLALKLASGSSHLVSIFDEVDAGIGGATAAAVGERLGRLAREGRQVLVITHSPQVAARGIDHWHVAKVHSDEATHTCVFHLTPQQRQEEIARMLAGKTVTAEARAAALQLLEAAS